MPLFKSRGAGKIGVGGGGGAAAAAKKRSPSRSESDEDDARSGGEGSEEEGDENPADYCRCQRRYAFESNRRIRAISRHFLGHPGMNDGLTISALVGPQGRLPPRHHLRQIRGREVHCRPQARLGAFLGGLAGVRPGAELFAGAEDPKVGAEVRPALSVCIAARVLCSEEPSHVCRYTDAAHDEVRILNSLTTKEDQPGIVGLYDNFNHGGPNGQHVCMMFELMGQVKKGTVLEQESLPFLAVLLLSYLADGGSHSSA